MSDEELSQDAIPYVYAISFSCSSYSVVITQVHSRVANEGEEGEGEEQEPSLPAVAFYPIQMMVYPMMPSLAHNPWGGVELAREAEAVRGYGHAAVHIIPSSC